MEIWQFTKHSTQIINVLNDLPEDKLIWIDAEVREVLSVIEKIEHLTTYRVHENHVEDCLNINHPCFYDSTQAYDLLIFRSLIANNTHSSIETMPVSFLIFKNLLITFSNHDNAIERVKKRLQTARKHIPTDSLLLTLLLVDEIVDNFLDLRGPLLERFDQWQQKLFTQTKQSLGWINFLKFKTEIRKLRVQSEDQQEAMYQWRQDNEVGLVEKLEIHFSDLADHIHRIIRYTTQLEGDLDTLIQLHYSLIGNRTNEVMRTLTVLSGIFLPLNLVASIFGMNFAHMRVFQIPDAENITLLGMAILGISLLIFFKWKKWI
ncbi:MAG: magnesium transporter CorA family protein [Gammaproteobacteria bacterium]|nr:magnesium transporter CorA family protein [Gammaproteobacteria bacterium]